jgi:hypothetical protein
MVTRQIDDELTRRLSSAGEQVAPADRVDRARLADLSARLRKARDPDWATAPDTEGRWLGLSKLFARGIEEATRVYVSSSSLRLFRTAFQLCSEISFASWDGRLVSATVRTVRPSRSASDQVTS